MGDIGCMAAEEREDLKEADRLEQAVSAWNRNGKKAIGSWRASA